MLLCSTCLFKSSVTASRKITPGSGTKPRFRNEPIEISDIDEGYQSADSNAANTRSKASYANSDDGQDAQRIDDADMEDDADENGNLAGFIADDDEDSIHGSDDMDVEAAEEHSEAGDDNVASTQQADQYVEEGDDVKVDDDSDLDMIDVDNVSSRLASLIITA